MTLYNTDALIWKHNVTVWWWFRWKSPGKCEEEDLASCKTIDGAEKEEVHSLETRYILFFFFFEIWEYFEWSICLFLLHSHYKPLVLESSAPSIGCQFVHIANAS